MVATLSPSRIPRSWDQVTPEWMTAAIRRLHPGAVVGAATLVNADDGSNRRARFALDYVHGTGPRTVFLKAHAPAHRFVHFRNGNLWNEARLFRSGVPLPVDHPFVYKAIVDHRGLDFLLVMEDMVERGADPRDATRPLTPQEVAEGLKGLARLHSLYWGNTRLSDHRLLWMKTWKPTRGWQVGLRRFVPRGLVRGGDALPDAVRAIDGDGVVDIWARYVATMRRRPMTLLHGDSHVGNVYVLPGGEVGFLDWQVVRRGTWHQDIGHFIGSALTIEDRRAHERALVETYRRALRLPGGGLPTAEEAWLAYRTTPAYGLAIWLSTLGTDGYQSREISQMLANRFAAAFSDLETLAALETAGA